VRRAQREAEASEEVQAPHSLSKPWHPQALRLRGINPQKGEAMTEERLKEYKDAITQFDAHGATSMIILLKELIAEIERLRAALEIARPICGETMSEDDPPCKCSACMHNARIDAALAPKMEKPNDTGK
jgi:hypothetical protein